jgi:hypothetical protein
MFATSRASATSLAIGIGLMLSISDVATQPYSSEQTTGEIWLSIEPYIQAPQKALELPEPSQPGDLEIAAGDVWPPRCLPPKP